MRTPAALAIAAMLAAGGTTAWAQQPSEPPASRSMAHMDEIMDRIRAVEDPEERADLLEQHLDEMHAAMAQIHASMERLMLHVDEQRSEQRRLRNHRRSSRR